MAQITGPQLERLQSLLAGQLQMRNASRPIGLSSTLELRTGTEEWKINCNEQEQFPINLVIGAFTLTGWITYCPKVSPGFLNQPSLSFAQQEAASCSTKQETLLSELLATLHQHYSALVCYCKSTTPLYSSPLSDESLHNILTSCETSSPSLSHTSTLSLSDGRPQLARDLGENVKPSNGMDQT